MNIGNTIEELERQRTKIDCAIASLRALNERSATQERPTIIEAVVAHLRRVGRKQTSHELRSAILAAGVNASESSFQTVLSRRARIKKDLLHVGRGMWGLKK